MKKTISVIMSVVILIFSGVNCNGIYTSVTEEEILRREDAVEFAAVDAAVEVDAQLMTYAKSVVLMEKSTGKVLYSENENEQLYPASVTKIMTILLVCEAIDSGKIKLSDNVVCSENAASKGGSQIWLEAGETMSVDDLLKATCVYSANDACTLLGEFIAGSETAFNDMMNNRAAELGMKNTHFDNCTGLDDTTETHLTTAYDVALMSRELLKYDFVKQYTTIWMDSLRDGKTELVNTNKLVRFYKGITGLKTGTTEKAGCCVAATAERDGMELIAVVMGSENSNDRFQSAENLLDWGFANYEIYTPVAENVPEKTAVLLGEKDFVVINVPNILPILINKGTASKITCETELNSNITAPVSENANLGKVKVCIEDEIVSEYVITAAESIDSLSFFGAFCKMLMSFSD